MNENTEITMKEADNTIDTTKIELPLMQEAFCLAYCDVGAETFGNGTKSAIAAKYAVKSAAGTGTRLLRKPHIKARLSQIQGEIISKHGISVESILAGIVHDQKMARQAGQFAVSNQCSKMLGDVRAMFSERLIIETEAKADKREQTPIEEQATPYITNLYNQFLTRGDEKLPPAKIVWIIENWAENQVRKIREHQSYLEAQQQRIIEPAQ